MTEMTLVPLEDDAPKAFVQAPSRRWPEGSGALLPRTPLPEVEYLEGVEAAWDRAWDSAVKWHDSKQADL